MKPITREWLRKAAEDLRSAKSIATMSPPHPGHVCFWCQQSAEKYLKALLQEAGSRVPRSHDLEWLLQKLVPARPTLAPLRRGLVFLRQFAEDVGIPCDRGTSRQAASAVKWAERVRAAVLPLLNPPKPRKKRPGR